MTIAESIRDSSTPAWDLRLSKWSATWGQLMPVHYEDWRIRHGLGRLGTHFDVPDEVSDNALRLFLDAINDSEWKVKGDPDPEVDAIIETIESTSVGMERVAESGTANDLSKLILHRLMEAVIVPHDPENFRMWSVKHPLYPALRMDKVLSSLGDERLFRCAVPAYLWLRARLITEWEGNELWDVKSIDADPLPLDGHPRHSSRRENLPRDFSGTQRDALNGRGSPGQHVAHTLARLGDLSYLSKYMDDIWRINSSGVIFVASGWSPLWDIPPLELFGHWSVLDPHRPDAPSSRNLAQELVSEVRDLGREGQRMLLLSTLSGIPLRMDSGSELHTAYMDFDGEEEHLVEEPWDH